MSERNDYERTFNQGLFNRRWIKALTAVRNLGEDVPAQSTAGAAGRGSRELRGGQLTVPMTYPVLSVPLRQLGYRFLCAEAAWILSGDNRVATIAPYSRQIARYSDDGLTFNGAYGPPLQDQLPYVWQTLLRDPSSRQAVATIWRPRPGPSKDVPCTLAVQWLLRRSHHEPAWTELHCQLTMRSWDLWLGVPYDVFNFSCLSAYVAARLLQLGFPGSLRLGTLTATAGSLHLYEPQLELLKDYGYKEFERAADEAGTQPLVCSPLLPLAWKDQPEELIQHLWWRAEHGGKDPEQGWQSSWLSELPGKGDA